MSQPVSSDSQNAAQNASTPPQEKEKVSTPEVEASSWWDTFCSVANTTVKVIVVASAVIEGGVQICNMVSGHYHEPIEVDLSKEESLASRAITAVTGRQAEDPITLSANAPGTGKQRPICLYNPSKETITATREHFRQASFQAEIARPVETAVIAVKETAKVVKDVKNKFGN